MASLRWGRVAAIHPEDYSVDLVMTDDGSRLTGVQVLTPSASSNTGYNDLPKPATPASGDVWDPRASTDRDVLAGVAFFGPYPVVIGFRYPQVCQMLFADLERRIDRHASDVYSTIDADGNMEVYHPSGTYLRIGTDPAHEDLTGKDFDKRWKIGRNTDKAVHIQLTVRNAGSQVASLNIDPSGNVTLDHAGSFTHRVGGSYSATVAGSYNVQSGGGANIDSPSLTHNGTNVGDSHVHGGVTPGGSNTAGPQ